MAEYIKLRSKVFANAVYQKNNAIHQKQELRRENLMEIVTFIYY